jgi:hypothetical protein
LPHKITPPQSQVLVALHNDPRDGIDASFGVPLDADGALLKYVRGALQLKDKSKPARLRYNIDFLADPCKNVADSANMEFHQAAYNDIKKIGESLRAGPLAKKLADDDLPPEHRGALAMLLGHCGQKKHAALLRKLIDVESNSDALRELRPLYFAYVLLEPDLGWDLLCSCSIQEEDSFLKRYRALTAIRRLGAERKDLVSQEKMGAALVRILNVKDMSDFAVEDLRKLRSWIHSDVVLDLFEKKGYDTPIIKHSILRYALQCPSPRAKAFVNEQRVRDPEWLTDTEERLALEAP